MCFEAFLYFALFWSLPSPQNKPNQCKLTLLYFIKWNIFEVYTSRLIKANNPNPVFSLSSFMRSDIGILIWASDTVSLKRCWGPCFWSSVFYPQHILMKRHSFKNSSVCASNLLLLLFYWEENLILWVMKNLRKTFPCFFLHFEKHKEDFDWIKYSLKKKEPRLLQGVKWAKPLQLSFCQTLQSQFCVNSIWLLKNRPLLLVSNNKIGILENLIS